VSSDTSLLLQNASALYLSIWTSQFYCPYQSLWSNPVTYFLPYHHMTRILNPFSLLNRETSSATNKLTQNKDLRTIQQILTSTALLGVYLSTLSSIQSKRNRFVFLFILLLWHISCTKHQFATTVSLELLENYISEIHDFSNNYKHILSKDGASFSSNTCPCFNWFFQVVLMNAIVRQYK
jgi:hypothetical protein